MATIPNVKYHSLEKAPKGSLLVLRDHNDALYLGLRASFPGDPSEHPAFVTLYVDSNGDQKATVLSPQGRNSVARPNATVLDHGINWTLNVHPEEWRPAGIAGLSDAGVLLAAANKGLALLAANYDGDLFELDLATWVLRPYSGDSAFTARRWTITIDSSPSVPSWSFPPVAAPREPVPAR